MDRLPATLRLQETKKVRERGLASLWEGCGSFHRETWDGQEHRTVCSSFTRDFCWPDGGSWSWVWRLQTNDYWFNGGLSCWIESFMRAEMVPDLFPPVFSTIASGLDRWPVINTVFVKWMSKWMKMNKWLPSSFPSQPPWRTLCRGSLSPWTCREHIRNLSKVSSFCIYMGL